MKKIIFVMLLHLGSSPSWSQGRTIKTPTPCNEEVLQKTPGKWIALGSQYLNGHGLSGGQVAEITKRVDAIHAIMTRIYPQPVGIDAAWHRMLGYGRFGEQVKFVTRMEGVQEAVAIKEKPVPVFGYISGFFQHFCAKEPNEIWSGYPGETGTWVKILANSLQPAIDGSQNSYGTMSINDNRVILLEPQNKEINGFKVLGRKIAGDEIRGYYRHVIIHRKGMMPYIPVSRKQYLDRCIPEVTKFWNENIKNAEQMPAGEERNELVKKLKEDRDKVLQLYKNEIDNTTKAGLLDVPAVIATYCNTSLDEITPVFVHESDGWLVVFENSDYMRKDLPKHVPQFFLVSWVCNDWEPQARIGKLMEEKFPFGQLQEMIDK